MTRGKSIHDMNSIGNTKARVPTAADRVTVLTAVLEGKTILEAAREAHVDRWTAEAWVTFAGWSNRAMVEAARDRYAAEAGS